VDADSAGPGEGDVAAVRFDPDSSGGEDIRCSLVVKLRG
jgi:hypothetical protein